jgi:dihydroorotase
LISKQTGEKVPAGVFTQPFCTQLVLLAFEDAITRGVIGEKDITQERLEQFLSRSGRRFYKLPQPDDSQKIILERKGEKIPLSISSADGTLEVGLSRATDSVFSLSWATV